MTDNPDDRRVEAALQNEPHVHLWDNPRGMPVMVNDSVEPPRPYVLYSPHDDSALWNGACPCPCGISKWLEDGKVTTDAPFVELVQVKCCQAGLMSWPEPCPYHGTTNEPDFTPQDANTARIGRVSPLSDDYLADLIRRVREEPDSLTDNEKKLLIAAGARLAKAVEDFATALATAFAPFVSAIVDGFNRIGEFAAAYAATLEDPENDPDRFATDDEVAHVAEVAGISWTEAWDEVATGRDMSRTSGRDPL